MHTAYSPLAISPEERRFGLDEFVYEFVNCSVHYADSHEFSPERRANLSSISQRSRLNELRRSLIYLSNLLIYIRRLVCIIRNANLFIRLRVFGTVARTR